MRLSTRIALVTAAIVPVLVILSGLLLSGLVTRDLKVGQDGKLQERAVAALPFARSELKAADTGRPRVQANDQHRLAAVALDVGVRLTAADGSVLLFDGPQPPVTGGPVLPAARRTPVTVSYDGTGWRAIGTAVPATPGQPGGTLWLFSPSSAIQDEVSAVQGRILLVALFAAPLGGLLAFLIAERAARPLRLLQRRTSGLDPDDPATRLSHRPTHVAEVDDLAHTLQSVLGRYDEQAARTGEALATAQAFAASASHELRTPLMSMRTNLDILADHPDLSPQERREVLDDLHGEHARLLGLLTALRSLAQGDLVEADAFGTVDLAELVESAVADLRRARPSARVTVHAWAAPKLPGWEPGLRIVVDNLLVNAMVHGGGTMAVELGLEHGTAVLRVDDQGPGVPPDQREAVFDRFRRGPDSPGSGLGLTLVAQQVALHRGSVRLTDPPSGHGTRVEVRLPTAAATTPLPTTRNWLTHDSAH
ncbi:sensor histidine kinase [Streptacidiphilus sp. EB129]|uniref:sensor histidine kinase n=1 Tax=Streptacidiphilus sp. EB129 TaxID=3156262 RepID=UPI003514A3E3